MPIKIILADDHRVLRDALVGTLKSESDLEVVGLASTGREAVELALKLKPQVVVMDVSMPELSGVEAAQQICSQAPQVRVLALTAYADKRYVLGMLRAGAAGYLLKDCALDELATAIRLVAAGKGYMSPEVAGVVAQNMASDPAQPSLTQKEQAVLRLIAEGCATKQVAYRLGVSEKTVETHRRQIMDKLGLRSVAELTKYAVREGLTLLDS